MIRILIVAIAMLTAGTVRADDIKSEALTVALQQCVEAIDSGQPTEEVQNYHDCVGVGANACQEEPGGDSTMGMVDCNVQEQGFWDDILNTAYGELKDRLEPEVFETLRAAQEVWIGWRDAKCEVLLSIFSEGSIRGVIFSSCLMETTADRAIDLLNIAYEM